MGSKLGAKRLLAEAGVPVLPDVDAGGLEGAALLEAAAAVGYPLLVKASAGGGGKGMRVVEAPDALEAAVASSRRLAADAFGDDTLLLERYVAVGPPRRDPDPRRPPRHRHAPRRARVLGPAPPPEDRRGVAVRRGRRRCCARTWATRRSPRARRSATSAPAPSSSCSRPDGAFFFLEVNTRLQVEHPVTEEVTGPRPRAPAARGRRRRADPGGGARARAARPRDRGAPLRRGPVGGLPARRPAR